MNAQIGFKEVQAYAQTHNVDFKTAAKRLGLSEKDAKQLEDSMNGGANWGKIMDELSFNPKRAEEYRAEAKAKQEKDVKDHPENYQPHKFEMRSGRYIVYQKDTETGKDTYKFYAKDGTEMKEADFKKEERMQNVAFSYDPKNKALHTRNEGQTLSFDGVGNTLKSLAAITFGLFASCSSGDEVYNEEINFNNTVNVTIPKNDQTALINAMKEGFEALQAEMKKLGYTVEKYGDQIVELLVQNNNKLDGISNELKNNGEQNEKIIEILTNINNTVSELKGITAGISADIQVNGQSVKTQLDAILKAIDSNNLSLGGLNDQMAKLQDLLKQVISNQEVSLIFQENSNMNEKKILDAINNIKYADESKQLATIVDILKEIKGITQNIDNKLDAIQNTVTEIKNKFGDDKIAAALDKLMEMVQANNDKADVTNDAFEKAG